MGLAVWIAIMRRKKKKKTVASSPFCCVFQDVSVHLDRADRLLVVCSFVVVFDASSSANGQQWWTLLGTFFYLFFVLLQLSFYPTPFVPLDNHGHFRAFFCTLVGLLQRGKQLKKVRAPRKDCFPALKRELIVVVQQQYIGLPHSSSPHSSSPPCSSTSSSTSSVSLLSCSFFALLLKVFWITWFFLSHPSQSLLFVCLSPSVLYVCLCVASCITQHPHIHTHIHTEKRDLSVHSFRPHSFSCLFAACFFFVLYIILTISALHLYFSVCSCFCEPPPFFAVTEKHFFHHSSHVYINIIALYIT